MSDKKLFRNLDGSIKAMLSDVEGISFKESPLDFFILLARYKFAARMIKNTHKVIDAGCGKGIGSVLLAKFAEEVIGGDYDNELVKANSKEYQDISNLTFANLDLLNISNEYKRTFDAVISMDVIEHFEKEDVYKVAKNYSSMIKDDGFAVIGTPNITSRPYASQRRLETHPFEFNVEHFEEVLRSSFKNVFIFSMTDETVSTSFSKMAWYLIAICTGAKD